MLNLRYVFNIEGKILIALGLFMATIFPRIFHFNDYELIKPVSLSLAISIFLGIALLVVTRNSVKDMNVRWVYHRFFSLGFYGNHWKPALFPF